MNVRTPEERSGGICPPPLHDSSIPSRDYVDTE